MIEIHYIESGDIYTIASPEQARDEFDKELAQLAISCGQTVTMGKFLARIIPDNSSK